MLRVYKNITVPSSILLRPENQIQQQTTENQQPENNNLNIFLVLKISSFL